jgi:TonB family protein
VRGAIIGSALVHVVTAVALLIARPSRTILVPGPDVVQVALVDAAMAELPAPSVAQAAPAPEPEPALEDQGVRLEKPKREKPKPARPEPAPPAAKPSPAPPSAIPSPARVVLPYASVGGGMAGQVAVDASNFEFAYYLQQVRTLIARNWAPSAGVAAGTRVEVYFRVSRDGSLSSPRIEVSSGNGYFDQSATRAVIVTGHLPPLPLGYDGGDLGIHFGFEYTGS